MADIDMREEVITVTKEEYLDIPAFVRLKNPNIRITESVTSDSLEVPTVLRKKSMTYSDAVAVAPVLIVGVGGAGGNFIDYLQQHELAGTELLKINTKAQPKGAIERISKRLARPSNAANELIFSTLKDERVNFEWQQFEELVHGRKAVVIQAGLGGHCGSELTPKLANVVRSKGITPMLLVSTPFKMEGKDRFSIAEQTIQTLTQVGCHTLIMNNETLLDLSEETSLREAFGYVDEQFREAIKKMMGVQSSACVT